ncbi:hypothetical protein V866_008743 [Kwoniella sp. B9012]
MRGCEKRPNGCDCGRSTMGSPPSIKDMVEENRLLYYCDMVWEDIVADRSDVDEAGESKSQEEEESHSDVSSDVLTSIPAETQSMGPIQSTDESHNHGKDSDHQKTPVSNSKLGRNLSNSTQSDLQSISRAPHPPKKMKVDKVSSSSSIEVDQNEELSHSVQQSLVMDDQDSQIVQPETITSIPIKPSNEAKPAEWKRGLDDSEIISLEDSAPGKEPIPNSVHRANQARATTAKRVALKEKMKAIAGPGVPRDDIDTEPEIDHAGWRSAIKTRVRRSGRKMRSDDGPVPTAEEQKERAEQWKRDYALPIRHFSMEERLMLYSYRPSNRPTPPVLSQRVIHNHRHAIEAFEKYKMSQMDDDDLTLSIDEPSSSSSSSSSIGDEPSLAKQALEAQKARCKQVEKEHLLKIKQAIARLEKERAIKEVFEAECEALIRRRTKETEDKAGG